MYAIRSYYVAAAAAADPPVPAAAPVARSPPVREKPGSGADPVDGLAARPADEPPARITSYNVCYTKLLRAASIAADER